MVETGSDCIGEMSNELHRVTSRVLSGVERFALLDFPDYANVGDSAIWLGELCVLEALGLGNPCYLCSRHTYDADRLRRSLGGGAILLSGGGNLGDLWPAHQSFREQVLRDFPHNRIVQLPQSIHFQGGEATRRARSAFGAHSDVTLLVRDEASLDFARAQLTDRVELCPDMAFGMGPLRRPAAPTQAVLWHSRQDKEAPSHGVVQAPQGLYGRDWLEDEPALVLGVHKRLRQFAVRHPRVLRYWSPDRLHRLVAESRLQRGLRFLSQGRVVVTNRLHGHILCVLLGIRHYVSDNSYGKVTGFIDMWTGRSDLVTVCASEQEALDRAWDEAGPQEVRL